MVQLKGLVPIGGIIEWSGAIIDIDPDWHLCDGTEGTPDLRDKFTPGAGGIYGVGDEGGALTHDHPFVGGSHFHESLGSINAEDSGDEKAWQHNLGNDRTSTMQVAGTVSQDGVLPPFFALAYIMRLT